jgi:hypothetical protein
MKYYFLILFALFFSSCEKSSSETTTNSLEKEYKNLNSDNVTMFFVESAKAYKGCAGSNCNSVYEFSFKNLSYASEISLTAFGFTKPIWTYYTTEKQGVTTTMAYDANEYRLKFTLKDGRVLFGPWVKF